MLVYGHIREGTADHVCIVAAEAKRFKRFLYCGVIRVAVFISFTAGN